MEQNEKIVLFAPHQDDEVISAFLYLEEQKQKGNQVSVIFATNGDYQGRNIASVRAEESIKALSRIGISQDDIYFMGYADTGMHPSKSFLFRLYHSGIQQVLSAPYSSYTYHPLNGETVHHIFYGKEAPYTKYSFYQDIRMIIRLLCPDILLIPFCFDFHGGHQALGKSIQEIVENNHLNIPRYSYLIHAGNDWTWPNRKGNTFICPEIISKQQWKKRVIFSFPEEKIEQKKKAIQLFITQQPTSQNNYLNSFAKAEEIFLREDLFSPSSE